MSIVVECMGPANGISRIPCARAALWTSAGPGQVDASGWSLTWKWDPTEGWTQGKSTIHTQRFITCVKLNKWKCTVNRSWAHGWLKLRSLLWRTQRRRRWSFPLNRRSKQPVRTKKARSCLQMSECCVSDVIIHTSKLCRLYLGLIQRPPHRAIQIWRKVRNKYTFKKINKHHWTLNKKCSACWSDWDIQSK